MMAQRQHVLEEGKGDSISLDQKGDWGLLSEFLLKKEEPISPALQKDGSATVPSEQKQEALWIASELATMVKKEALKRQMRAAEKVMKKKMGPQMRFSCGICGKLFSSKFNLRRHMNNVPS